MRKIAESLIATGTLLALVFVLILVANALAAKSSSEGRTGVKVISIERGLSAVEKDCIDCHQEESPLIVLDWRDSLHGRANVTCLDCHQAERSDADAFQCSGLKGGRTRIAAIVTPKDCSRCHPVEAAQFNASDHAGAVDSVSKLEDMAVRWEGKGTTAALAAGCIQCHGYDIELKDGKPTGATYPQEGIGRINPDGSKGNCAACHTRHKFNIAEARRAETCGSCHMGPDHPQYEIWLASKHGKRYLAEGDSWNWESSPDAWEPGDYSAPTCAVCHMSGIGALETTHNISERLAWEAERPLSVRTDHWQEKQEQMHTVCLNCHGPNWVDGWQAQYDQVIETYNEKYYQPAKAMMDELYEKKLITGDDKWDEDIEMDFYELWHHEGRRARMGAAMMGQDYVQWHGFYEVATKYRHIVEEYERLTTAATNR